MKIDVNRLCELAGLGSGSRGLVTETVAPAPVKPAAAPVKPVAVVPAKPGAPAKPAAAKPAAPVAEMHYMSDDDEGMEGMFDDESGMYEMDDMDGMDGMEGMYEMDDMEDDGAYMEDDAMYEINEEELAEALVSMRQANLDESYVRDAVREEIARALRTRGASWLYGKNQPTNSKIGQVVRGGYGIGFK